MNDRKDRRVGGSNAETEGVAGEPTDGTGGRSVDGVEERSAPLLVVEELRTYYREGRILGGPPVKAVDGVTFEIARGETFGIVGESGCGKTTLGRSILQLEEVDDGSVVFDGTEVTALGRRALKAWRRDAQMVYQNPMSSINERMTVGEIVREPLDVHDWGTAAERRERVETLLDRVGLRTEHYYRYPHQFSGGQRQRIGIARALALEPEFIVLDEPVSALDVSVQAKILNLLSELQDEFGLTYLLIAHDLSVVRHICDRVGVMYLGKLMEVGPTEQLFSAPANPYTRSLLSAIPQPDPDVGADRITLRGTPPSPRNPPSGCVFSTRCPFEIRPEGYELTDEQWERIDELRHVLRERQDESFSPIDSIKARLRGDDRGRPISEVVESSFERQELPGDVEAVLEETIGRAEDGDVAEALGVLEDEFGTICEREQPAHHRVEEGQVSRCHRHLPEFADPSEHRPESEEYLPE